MHFVHEGSGPSSVSDCALPLGKASTMSHSNSRSMHSYARTILWLKHTLRAPLSWHLSLCRKPVLGVWLKLTLRVSLSVPPNSARFGYATEVALFISAQLSTDAVSAPRKVWVLITLRASLSGTFIQTLPDLVTPLKGHSLSPRSCPPTRSVPSERFGY